MQSEVNRSGVRSNNGTVYSMEWSYGAELWSGVLELSIGMEWSQILEWQMSGTVLLPGITEHNMIGKIDCSFDPCHMSRCA